MKKKSKNVRIQGAQGIFFGFSAVVAIVEKIDISMGEATGNRVTLFLYRTSGRKMGSLNIYRGQRW